MIPGDELFISYSIVICCFMAGTVWGRAISQESCPHRSIKLVISNLVALAVFFGWLSMESQGLLVILIISYLLLLASELKLREEAQDCAVATSPYLALRTWITCTVLLLHAVLLLMT